MTECNRCGNCCEDITLNMTKRDLRCRLAANDLGERTRQDAEFILRHWHGGVRNGPGKTQRWSCDRFDVATRLCTAHEERPPICRDYPWYGLTPRAGAVPLGCAFIADVPVPVEIRKAS